MPLIRVTAKMPYSAGLNRDVSENTFSFLTTDSLDPTLAATITDRVKAFYNTAALGGASHSVSFYISPIVSRTTNACTFVVAEVNATTGLQVEDSIEVPWTLGSAESSVSSLPLEVAMCVSYSGHPDGGFLPKGRRRGRIFVGPLTVTAMAGGTDPSIATTIRNETAAAAAALASSADETAAWVVWSRAANAVTGISEGYIDNEFDTQRRRGNDATARTTWVAS